MSASDLGYLRENANSEIGRDERLPGISHYANQGMEELPISGAGYQDLLEETELGKSIRQFVMFIK
jgi:hypothetical protein